MLFRNTVFFIFVICIALSALAEGVAKSSKMLMIFFRSDCPPCRQEMMVIPEIAAAHKALAIEIVSLDGAQAEKYIPGALPENVYSAAAGKREKDIMRRAGDEKLVLPLSVFLDGGGQLCGRHQGILGTDRVNRWMAIC